MMRFNVPANEMYMHVEKVLSEELLAAARVACALLPPNNPEGVMLGRKGQPDGHVHQARAIRKTDETKALYECIADRMRVVNQRFIGADIAGTSFLNYYAYGVGDGIGLHVDSGHRADSGRYKLTMIVQLSEPSDYDGGDMRLKLHDGSPDDGTVAAFKAAGDGLLFRSYVPHEVTPITRGERKVLVVWGIGPDWR